MIRCRRCAEPPRFDAEVRQPGLRWLATHAAGRLPSYWRAVNAEVAAAFDWRCAYLAVCIEASGEVDL
jgi:hypothetical protein